MKKKFLILLPILLSAAGGTYKLVGPEPPAPPKAKVEGQVIVLPKDFYINLRAGRFAKLGLALVLDPHAQRSAGHGGKTPPAEPPEGYSGLPQEAIVRSIVTDALTDQPAARLLSSANRRKLLDGIVEELERRTDVGAEQAYFTDLAVQ